MAYERYTLDVRALIERAGNTWKKRILNRLFSSAAETLGSSGKSVPFADGGTADPGYVPPSNDGRSFLYTHNHFGRAADDAAGRLAAVKAMVAHLQEHGHQAPFDLVVPEVDAADWVGVTGFKYPERAYLNTAGVETRALVPDDQFLGIIDVERGWARVVLEPRLPTNYAGMFKPMGYGSPSNPLAVRYEEGFPLGLTMVATPNQFPLQDAIAYFTFGVGVANRTAGTAYYFAASGDYTDPTIS